jgi:hypothetical protein
MLRNMLIVSILFQICITFLAPNFAYAALTLKDDPRYCGFVPRNPDGTIKRSTTILKHFMEIHPCPTLYRAEGVKCGTVWIKDHVIPLDCGGCDSIINLQWLTWADWMDKSRYERKIYGGNHMSIGCP